MDRGLRSMCDFNSSFVTLAVLREPVCAATIRCLFAETTPGQGTIEAEQSGEFADSHVWDIYASSGATPSANIVIDILNVQNMNEATTNANPSSYNLWASGGGSTGFVYRGYREVGVSGNLLNASQDGIFDADIYADEAGGLEIDPDDLTDVNVNENYP